jgi:hypothetical protein
MIGSVVGHGYSARLDVQAELFTPLPFPQGSRFDLGQFLEVRLGGDFVAALGFEFAAGIASDGASGTGGLLVGGKTSAARLRAI